MKNITSKRISLMKKTGNKKLLTLDFTGFPYLGIWSKPKAPFICIEPWMTTADSVSSSGIFAERTDLIMLAPKQEFECKYKIDFFN